MLLALRLGYLYVSMPSKSGSQVFQTRFWMMLHGGGTPKPSLAYSNMAEVQGLDLGRLTKAEKQKRTTATTVRDLSNSLPPS